MTELPSTGAVDRVEGPGGRVVRDQEVVDFPDLNPTLSVPLIDTLERAQEELLRLTSGTRTECLSALPAGPYPLEVLESSFDDDIAMSERGVRSFMLYQTDASRSPEVIRHMTRLTAHGIHIRLRRHIPRRMLICDRRAALVASEEGARGRPWMLLEQPALVAMARAHFLRLWNTAQAIGLRAGELNEAAVRETLELLLEGLTDQQVALRLGVTDRTVRRRVAAVMQLLGAGSRFECGVKAAHLGWL